jgi:hypothetical protein
MHWSAASITADWKKTHSDHGEDSADGTKNGLGWCGTQDLLCEIHGLDGGIQQRESTILTSLGLGIHGRN